MSGGYDEIDLTRIRTITIEERESKVSVEDYGSPVKGGKGFRRWFDSLPDQLAAEHLRELAARMRQTRSSGGREIIWMTGAHVIKCGLPPYLIALMKKGYITALAVNGACAIHDTEIAFFGRTSEDVATGLVGGTFGFSAETAGLLFEAVARGNRDGQGLGEALGRFILRENAPHRDVSIFAQACRFNVPVTVHIAIGTDIVNQHPGFDGASWGALSARDFRIFCGRVENLGRAGGVVINSGSAVILPEVFLKALSVARNLGAPFSDILTCNIDMIQHYRPSENVLRRPASFGGRSISLTGHHEIMIPLLYSALLS